MVIATNGDYSWIATVYYSLGVSVSMSIKASPWENGYQKSFFNIFKTDLGLEFDRFGDTRQMAEAIYHTIHDYNYPEFIQHKKCHHINSDYGFKVV